jgi:hypothetical protein
VALWATRSHLHLDRVATAWLILRFIDAEATFAFIDDIDDLPPKALPFGLPGIPLSSHDDAGTTFAKTMHWYRLREPALVLLERMVAEGVCHALQRDLGDDDPEVRATATALDLIGVGMGVLYEDDSLLLACLPIYDALYILCQARTLPADVRDALPPGPPAARTAYLRQYVHLPT